VAIDAFLKLGDLEGESVVKGFEKQMDILAWSWGLSQSGTTHTGTGGGAGKVNVQDLSVTKWVDKSSPALVGACCKGDHFPKAVLTLRKAGGSPLPYLSITLEDILITSVSTSSSAGEERQSETVSLNFAKFTYSYQPQDKQGAKQGGSVDVTYDIAKND
jgi:type VI secretion system secreted protein Hcp